MRLPHGGCLWLAPGAHLAASHGAARRRAGSRPARGLEHLLPGGQAGNLPGDRRDEGVQRRAGWQPIRGGDQIASPDLSLPEVQPGRQGHRIFIIILAFLAFPREIPCFFHNVNDITTGDDPPLTALRTSGEIWVITSNFFLKWGWLDAILGVYLSEFLFNRLLTLGKGMLEARLLGQFEVLHNGRHVTIPTRKAQSLFAYLILNAGKSHRRERLAGLLWPDSSEENARSNLRHEFWRLRKAIEAEGESFFRVNELTITFSPQGEYSLDVHELERVTLEGSTADDLIRALSIYRGELLPGFYDEWVFVERERLNALFETKLSRLMELLQAEGRWMEVLDWGTRWIALGGWPEPAYRALIAAYANTGNISKAAATYEHYAQTLQKDLGLKPSEQTQALYIRLKTGWKMDTPKSPIDKSASAPPLPKVRRSIFPKPLTSFIGREKEIQQVKDLVSITRLVTIIGTAGVGKTRLAIQVAEALAPQFRDGVRWVELASLLEINPSKKQDFSHNGSPSPVQDSPMSPVGYADLVPQAVAKVLRVPESPDLSLLEGILEHLHDRQLLLILDNCEHLIKACAALAERVLVDCPQVSILATSREALGVPGERAWLLPTLSLPVRGPSMDFSDIVQSEAVRLFIERTANILPGYKLGEIEASTIAQICLRLDGIPLAIELAAARMNLLTAKEIATHLDRRFSLLMGGHRTALPRHKALRAALEWSHELLSEAERVLFRRLSIFAGSFTLEAAEAICAGEGIHGDEVLSLLGRLFDKTLLNVEPAPRDADLATRYRFLDSIRSFGHLKLDEAGETRWMRDRHAEYYVRLAEAAEPEFYLNKQVDWYRLLQAENDNIRAVFELSAENDQAESALRLTGALRRYWFFVGPAYEGRDLAIKALALPSAIQYKNARARALNTAGYLQFVLGDTASARKSLQEALSLLRSSDDVASLAWTLQFLGLALTSEGEFNLADAALIEGSALARKLGKVYIDSLSFFQGDVYLQMGDRSRAKNIYEESVNKLRTFGDKASLGYPLRRLGYLALEQNDIPSAWKYFQESLMLNLEVGDKLGVAACLTSLAAMAIHLGKLILATQLYGVVESRLELLSMNLLYLDQAMLGRIRSQLSPRLGQATFETAFTEGWYMNEEQAIGLVEKIIGEEDKHTFVLSGD